MKFGLKFILAFTLTFSSIVLAQEFYPNPNEVYFGSAAGLTWIDNEPFYAIHLFPEVAFAKIGIGLNLSLEFNQQGKLRSENFNEFSDYLSLIRYVKYGKENDPFYARLGALDYATLGHGSIIYLYNNSPSFDSRKIGLEFNVDFNLFGIEAVYGTFAESGLVGVRPYVRPLLNTQLGAIPILGGLELGASYTTDFNKYAGVTSVKIANQGNYKIENDLGAIEIVGFDVSFPILRTNLLDADIYIDYAKIIDFGNGKSAGIQFDIEASSFVDIRTKFERRFNGVNYIPAYFNFFYEKERFQIDESTNQVNSKIQLLQKGIDIGNGYYGELFVSVLKTFYLFGSYQRLDENSKSGILNLRTDISPENGLFVARAGYDKLYIKDERDLFTLDDRSYLFAEVGYKLNPYLLISLFYRWTFSPVKDLDDNIIKYIPQKKIEPRISFIYPFSIQ